MVKAVGLIEVMLSMGDNKHMFKLLVVRRGCRMLLGRNLIKLEYEVTQINSISDNVKLQEVLQDFQLFNGVTGKYEFSKVEMKVVCGTKPIFCKPRPVLFSFKD